MIHIILRKRLAPGQTEASFVEAWRRLTRAVCGTAEGALGGTLYRSQADPPEYIATVRWASLEAWRAFWECGVPDPEASPTLDEILVEVADVRPGS